MFPQGHKGGVLLRVRDEPEDFLSAEGQEPGLSVMFLIAVTGICLCS